jgi:plastocyanin
MRKFCQKVLCLSFIFIFNACEKTDQGFTAVGGQLPGHNIVIKDSSFSPASLSVVAGSTINFLNQSSSPHTIISDDSIAIKPVVIAPGSYYIFKPGYSGIVSFHCATHTTARGVLIISP